MKKTEYVKPQTEVTEFDSHCMVQTGSKPFTMMRGNDEDGEDPNGSRRHSSWFDDEY